MEEEVRRRESDRQSVCVWGGGYGDMVLPAPVHEVIDVVKFLCLENSWQIDVAPTVTAP